MISSWPRSSIPYDQQWRKSVTIPLLGLARTFTRAAHFAHHWPPQRIRPPAPYHLGYALVVLTPVGDKSITQSEPPECEIGGLGGC
jgi:hypothetical protein